MYNIEINKKVSAVVKPVS